MTLWHGSLLKNMLEKKLHSESYIKQVSIDKGPIIFKNVVLQVEYMGDYFISW